MSTTTPYTAPRRGCSYEEEGIHCDLFYAASTLDLTTTRLQHLVDDTDRAALLAGKDEAPGPLILEIPRKYLIEARPLQYTVPTTAQLAVPAPTPTLDDRLRRQSGRT